MGVTVPDAPGEPVAIGSDVVDWKSVESDALDRRYGMLDKDARGDLAGFERWPLETWRLVSESESCGDCSGSSGVGVMRKARCSPARYLATIYGHLYAGGKAEHCTGCVVVVTGLERSRPRSCCFVILFGDRERRSSGVPRAKAAEDSCHTHTTRSINDIHTRNSASVPHH